VCGGCLPRLAELTAETLWQSVRCIGVLDRTARVKSFRFEMPENLRAGTIKPGQRIMVQAPIGGVDVQRSYTLTSPVTEQRYYEITVQREPHGVMSGWLFEHMRPGVAIEILPPSGTCFFELTDSRPLVCLVGGIGLTPAIGISRSAVASGSRRRVHVDYSASTRDELVCADELREMADRHDTISARTRITREEGRFGADDLKKLASEFARVGCSSIRVSRRAMFISNPSIPSAARCSPRRRRRLCCRRGSAGSWVTLFCSPSRRS
jgi:ferredoxin-NADP reductase